MKLSKADIQRIEERKEKRRVVDRETRYIHEGRKRMEQIKNEKLAIKTSYI